MVNKPSYEELGQRIKELEKEYVDRKQAEAALRENEQFLQSIFDAIQDGISVLDSELNIVRVNLWIQNLHLVQIRAIGFIM